MANKYMTLSVRMLNAAGTPDDIRVSFGRNVRLVGVLCVPNVATAAHATNYAIVSVTDGTTSLWTWSTLSSADGAFVEGTPVGVSPYATVGSIKALTASASGSQDVDQDGSFEIVSDQTNGTGAAIDCTVVIIAEPISA